MPLRATACTYRIAFGPHGGTWRLTLQGAMRSEVDLQVCDRMSSITSQLASRARNGCLLRGFDFAAADYRSGSTAGLRELNLIAVDLSVTQASQESTNRCDMSGPAGAARSQAASAFKRGSSSRWPLTVTSTARPAVRRSQPIAVKCWYSSSAS